MKNLLLIKKFRKNAFLQKFKKILYLKNKKSHFFGKLIKNFYRKLLIIFCFYKKLIKMFML